MFFPLLTSFATKSNMIFRRCHMSKVIEAIFENGIFRPLSEPRLKNHQRVRIEILSEEDESSVEVQKKILLEFAGLGKSNATDVARNHDRYLYLKDEPDA
jgi:predicted DNA-binding antitoxin AbrB/MazE fold protein